MESARSSTIAIIFATVGRWDVANQARTAHKRPPWLKCEGVSADAEGLSGLLQLRPSKWRKRCAKHAKWPASDRWSVSASESSVTSRSPGMSMRAMVMTRGLAITPRPVLCWRWFPASGSAGYVAWESFSVLRTGLGHGIVWHGMTRHPRTGTLR
jgi:hypothetical protein